MRVYAPHSALSRRSRLPSGAVSEVGLDGPARATLAAPSCGNCWVVGLLELEFVLVLLCFRSSGRARLVDCVLSGLRGSSWNRRGRGIVQFRRGGTVPAIADSCSSENPLVVLVQEDGDALVCNRR